MTVKEGPQGGGSSEPSQSDEEVYRRLEYLADILHDLQSFSGMSGGATLNGLLALAECEALLRAERFKPKNG